MDHGMWDSARQPWDRQDDPSEALPELLRVAGWDDERVDRCRSVYESLPSVEGAAGAAATTTFLATLGVPATMEAHYYRAMLRGTRLSFYDFLVALVAMDPTTAHGGVWNGLRAQYVFRVYDQDGDGELSATELAVLLGHVRLAYGQPSLEVEAEMAEAAALHEQLTGAVGTRLTLPVFREAVGQLKLRGCSRLYRTEFPLCLPAAKESAATAVAAAAVAAAAPFESPFESPSGAVGPYRYAPVVAQPLAAPTLHALGSGPGSASRSPLSPPTRLMKPKASCPDSSRTASPYREREHASQQASQQAPTATATAVAVTAASAEDASDTATSALGKGTPVRASSRASRPSLSVSAPHADCRLDCLPHQAACLPHQVSAPDSPPHADCRPDCLPHQNDCFPHQVSAPDSPPHADCRPDCLPHQNDCFPHQVSAPDSPPHAGGMNPPLPGTALNLGPSMHASTCAVVGGAVVGGVVVGGAVVGGAVVGGAVEGAQGPLLSARRRRGGGEPPPSPGGEVRFAFKKVVLEAPMTYRSLSSASPKGLLGRAAAPTGLQRQTSVDIDPTDAAIQKRQVEMHARSWLAPPSPAPGKDVAKRVCDTLLLGGWDAAALERCGMGEGSLEYVCTDAELLIMCKLCLERRMWTTSSLVPLKAPLKIFGDLHGQFGDLQRFFAAFGSPNAYTGDVDYCSYLFLGDYVDRGKHSLEVVALLLALKICHPSRVTLLRGNHEDPQVNAHYGFRQECMRRCRDGAHVWTAINQVFEMMPVAALIDDVVLAVHGGIGESLQNLDQLRELPRPVSVNLSQRNVLNEVSH